MEVPQRYRLKAKHEAFCYECPNSKYSLGGTFELTSSTGNILHPKFSSIIF